MLGGAIAYADPWACRSEVDPGPDPEGPRLIPDRREACTLP